MHSLLPSPSLSPQVTRLLAPNPASTSPSRPRHVTLSATRTTLDLDLDPALLKKESSPTQTTTDTPSAAYWDYQFLFLSQRTETQTPITLIPVVGHVPLDFPLGTYYLTGPGLFTDDHGSTVHPLDGHGYLRAFEIGSDVKYSAKYIKTEAQREEMINEGWRFTHRGPFSVLRAGRRLGNTKVMKNVANTSVVKWGGRLMCLWEGGEPYEVDEGTLDTLGTVDLARGESMHVVERRGLVDLAAALLKPILHGNHVCSYLH